MIIYTITILTCIIIGGASVVIAKRKGKEPMKWFLIGSLLNMLVLVTIIFVDKKKKGS
jgi:hypothetical protein